MVIDLNDITRVYRSGTLSVEALRGITASVAEGGVLSVMGASGSGKSTLMNSWGGLASPPSGDYRLNGEPVSSLKKEKLAPIRNKTLGFVFQNFHLLPKTSALENVELPLFYSRDALSWKEIQNRAKEALKVVGLENRRSEEYTSELQSRGHLVCRL